MRKLLDYFFVLYIWLLEQASINIDFYRLIRRAEILREVNSFKSMKGGYYKFNHIDKRMDLKDRKYFYFGSCQFERHGEYGDIYRVNGEAFGFLTNTDGTARSGDERDHSTWIVNTNHDVDIIKISKTEFDAAKTEWDATPTVDEFLKARKS